MERGSGYYYVKEDQGRGDMGWSIANWNASAGWWMVCGNEIPHYDEDFLVIYPTPIFLPE